MTKTEIVKKVGEIDYSADASQDMQDLYREILTTGSIGLLRACLRMAYFAGKRDASETMENRASALTENSEALMELTAGLFDN